LRTYAPVLFKSRFCIAKLQNYKTPYTSADSTE